MATSFNGKPKATALSSNLAARAVAFGLPLNN
jgi:hypothetical protein